VKVKLSYTADLEEIPEELVLLFENIFNKSRAFAHQAETADALLTDGDVEPALAIMNKMRMTMVEMDTRLADLSSIAEGYLAYRNKGVEDEASSGRPAMDTTGGNALQGSEQPNGGEVQ
jgi:hypothetical protein